MDLCDLKPIIEAMIFVSDEPITEGSMAAALADAGVEKAQIRECLDALGREWNDDAMRGIGLVSVAGGYQFRTKPAHAEWLRRMSVPKPMRLSGPALETLAIVAYRQPLVRSDIERIRGVDSGAVLKTLLDRRLIRIVGRRDEPGQPLLYGTTRDFLEIFNLSALAELPTLKDIEELMRERRTLTEVQAPGFAASAANDEPTEPIEEGEEETEIIPKKQLPEDEEEDALEHKDMEALSELEKSLKDLRRLERNVFPRPLIEERGEETTGGGGDGGEISTTPEGAVDAAAPSDGEERSTTAADGGGSHAPPADDCPFK